ncbi:MAG: ATP-grasp domain-containing protein [Gammaproteobacteria bacterium]
MRFADSLTEFTFLSELYAEDAPQGVLLAEYPSSNSTATRYNNTHKFIIHDPYPPPAYALLKVLGPHHLMHCWGGEMPVASEVRPPERLLTHWVRVFGEAVRPRWQSPNGDARYITLFPFETLPTTQHFMDPEQLYALHGKEALANIECPQMKVLEKAKPPCVIKLSHGYAGKGNFVVRNEADLHAARAELERRWPDARTVVNEFMQDIVGDFGVQFYVRRDGEVVWLGFTRQIFNEQKHWAGGSFSADMQDTLSPHFEEMVRPVAKYLHRNGYYGVAGIDVLQNRSGSFFLTDLNPRLTGITPFLMASRILLGQAGLTDGIYSPSLSFSGTLRELIERADRITDARVIVLSGYEDLEAGRVTCHLAVHATSPDVAQKVLANF